MLAATAGNVLGAVVNYVLGRFLLRIEGRLWSPVIGDPLTCAAGLLRTPTGVFLAYVTIGKAARYAVLLRIWIRLFG